MIYFQALDGSITMLNDVASRITGHPTEAFADRDLWRRITHPDDRDAIDAFSRDYPEGTTSLETGYRLRDHSGQWRWIHVRMVGAKNGNGQYTGYNCIGRDITGQVKTEEALRDSEARLRAIFDTKVIGIVTVNQTGKIAAFNRGAESLFGYTAEEIIGQPVTTLSSPEVRSRNGFGLNHVLEKELTNASTTVESLARRKDGTIFPVEITVGQVKFSDAYYQTFLIKDITDRKLAEEELKKYQEHLQEMVVARTAELREIKDRVEAILDSSSDGIVLATPEGMIGQTNLTFNELFGCAPDEHYGKHLSNLFEEESRKAISQVIGEIDDGTPARRTELRARRKDGTVFDVEVGISRVQSSEPLRGLVCNLRDITARKQAESALKESEERYRGIVEDQTEMICRWKPDGTITFVNRAYSRFVRRPTGDLIEKSFLPVAGGYGWVITQRIDLGTQQARGLIEYEIETRQPDGQICWQHWTERAIYDEQNRIIEYQGVGRDITQIKRAEAALQETLKQERELSELQSRFISMASHEFRTPLATILSSSELIERYHDRMSPDDVQKETRRIYQQVKHMNRLLEDVLAIGKAESGEIKSNREQVDVPALCGEIIREMRRNTAFKHKIVYTQQQSGDCLFWLDKIQLRQIITNLLSNAIKYSPDSEEVYVDLNCTDDEFCLKVRDTGIGIPEQDQQRLFQAFHRAGNVGSISGTGLGLAITKHLVDQNNGTITFESEPGTGTTFTVVLPRNRIKAD